MSDARDKLQAAIDAKKTGGGGKAPLPKIPKAKSAPAPSEPAPVTNRSAGPAEKPKPEKSKPSFLKKKKKTKPKEKPSAKKSGGGFGDVFGKLTKNLVDEFKEATSEISHGQLISNAKDGISNLGISLTSGDDSAAKDRPTNKDADSSQEPHREGGLDTNSTAASPAAPNDVTAAPSKQEAPKESSAAKVPKTPPTRQEREQSSETPEAELVAEGEPVPAPDDIAGDVSETEEIANATNSSTDVSVEAPEAPNATPDDVAAISKEEKLIRAFHSLHVILNSEIWNPIVTDSNSKPSSIFSPREHFDNQWATPEFRDGLKAASRLATGFTFNPAGVEFEQVAIEAVKNYAFDPQKMIKPHTELLTKAIGSKQTEEVLVLVKKGKVSKLLYSVGTRLSTFVPTIEILARIYIGLRKKEDLIPGIRLQIQDKVCMKYGKSPYTEDMAKKARNLSLNYFMDYLTEYGFDLYKDRMEQASEGQNDFSTQKRRHATISQSCINLAREWGTKVGVSTPAMINLEARLREMTDSHLSAIVGEVPENEGDE